MKTIAMIQRKGGVGRTTIASLLVSGLAMAGYKVLAIDTDSQANLTTGLGGSVNPGIVSLFEGRKWSDLLRYIPQQIYCDPSVDSQGELWLLPSAEANEEAPRIDKRRYVLRKRLSEIENSFDYCVIDTSPSGDEMHNYIYTAMDYALVPAKMEQYSFDGIQRTVRIIHDENEERKLNDRSAVKLAGIIPNHVRPRTVEHRDNLEALRNSPYAQYVLPSIDMNVRWSEINRARVSIFAYDPQSKSAAQAKEIVDNVIEVTR